MARSIVALALLSVAGALQAPSRPLLQAVAAPAAPIAAAITALAPLAAHAEVPLRA